MAAVAGQDADERDDRVLVVPARHDDADQVIVRVVGEAPPGIRAGQPEEDVERFLGGELSFTSIVEVVSRVIDKHARDVTPVKTLEDAMHWDSWARKEARGIDVAIQRR